MGNHTKLTFAAAISGVVLMLLVTTATADLFDEMENQLRSDKAITTRVDSVASSKAVVAVNHSLPLAVECREHSLSFSDYKQCHRQEFFAWKKQLLAEFENFKNINRQEQEKYHNAITAVWDEPLVSTQKVWVEYSNDMQERKSVDFEKETLSIARIINGNGNGNGNSKASTKTLKDTVRALLQKNKAEAFRDDRVASAVQARIKKEINPLMLEDAVVAPEPILIPYITGSRTVSADVVDQIASAMVEQGKTFVSTNNAGHKVITTVLPLKPDREPATTDKPESVLAAITQPDTATKALATAESSIVVQKQELVAEQWMSEKASAGVEQIPLAGKQTPGSEALALADKQTPHTEALALADKQTPDTEALALADKQTPDTEALALADKQTPDTEVLALADKQALNTDPVALSGEQTPGGEPVEKSEKSALASEVPVRSSVQVDNQHPARASDQVAGQRFAAISPARLPVAARPFREDVRDLSLASEVPQSLVFAIMETESVFYPMATSSFPAYGLMQIIPGSSGMYATEKLFGKSKILSPAYLYNSRNNIEVGTVYLNILYDIFKRVEHPRSRLYCAIAAYNAGPVAIAKTFTATSKLNPALNIINTMQPEELYAHMRENLPYLETRLYLEKVNERIKHYEVW